MQIMILSSGEAIKIVGARPVVPNHVWSWQGRGQIKWFISDRTRAYGPMEGIWDKAEAEMMLLKLMLE